MEESSEKQDSTIIVKTDIGSKDGQEKCPKCGSTDIETNIKTGQLRCNFCRHEFKAEKVKGLVEDLSSLEGTVVASGAKDIIADAKDVITFKCSSCGAEVVIDTASATQARCHWCRNMLSINQQIPNGSIPDVVLPFKIPKDDARAEIDKFVSKRKFYANPTFKKEFTSENIMGVYFPYMIVDMNASANFIGEGEHQTRRYTVGTGDNQKTYYDADLYHVERKFDIVIDNLSVESNSDRLDTTSKDKTNNIINSIMPFDTENCVKYNANFLHGYTSERRDTNIENLNELVSTQGKDIARFKANETLQYYDRGVRWDTEDMKIKGSQWQAAYLPVWLYSYQEVKGNKKLLHYVAVNARTKETMGSVPIHMPKLILISALVEIVGIFGMLEIEFDGNWIFVTSGIIYFVIMYSKYRNSGARHKFETETKSTMSNLKEKDDFVKHEKGLSNSTMSGANNKSVHGTSVKVNALDAISSKEKAIEFIKKNVK